MLNLGSLGIERSCLDRCHIPVSGLLPTDYPAAEAIRHEWYPQQAHFRRVALLQEHLHQIAQRGQPVKCSEGAGFPHNHVFVCCGCRRPHHAQHTNRPARPVVVGAGWVVTVAMLHHHVVQFPVELHYHPAGFYACPATILGAAWAAGLQPNQRPDSNTPMSRRR